MPVPKDFKCTLVFHTSALHHVVDVSAICPYCRIASTFEVKTVVYKYNNSRGSEIRFIIECNHSLCHEQTFVLLKLPLGTYELRPNHFFYMSPSRAITPRHPAVPTNITEDWEEAQNGMEAGAVKAAAVMCRRVLYGVLLDKKCKLKPLKDGAQQLINENRLPAIFDSWLPAITDDGHDAAHPDRALNVSTENITETMEYTSELLRVLYVEPWEFEERKKRIAAAKASPTKTI